MYVGPDVIDQLPQGQTQFKPGFTGPIQEPSREVFDMLHAASVKAQAVAQRKAVDAEQERLQADWFLRHTAGQLRQFQAAAKAKNDFDKQMAMQETSRLVQAGSDPLSAAMKSGLYARLNPSEQNSLNPRKPRFTPSEVVSMGGQNFIRQRDETTGREINTRIPSEADSPEAKLQRARDEYLFRQGRSVKISRLKQIEKEISANAVNLPQPKELETLSRDPQRSVAAAELRAAVERDLALKRELAKLQKELTTAGAELQNTPEGEIDEEVGLTDEELGAPSTESQPASAAEVAMRWIRDPKTKMLVPAK
jgi:hypothetical protein